MNDDSDDRNNLDFILQYFWGSSYWSAALTDCKQLSETTKRVLLNKSRDVDVLRQKLMQAEKTIDHLVNNNEQTAN